MFKKMFYCFISLSIFSLIFFDNYVEASQNDSIVPLNQEYNAEYEGEEYILDETRSNESNVVHYNLQTSTMEYMYLNNSINTIINVNDSYTSYTQNLVNEGNPPCVNQLENDLELINPVYNRIGKIHTSTSYGTAFLMGPNIALTSGHCVLSSSTHNFINGLKIDFGYNGYSYYSRVNVTDVYVLKLYYDEAKYANDWAICVLDENIGDILGYFGKCTGYNLIGLDATIIGYAGGQGLNTQYSSVGEIVKNYPTFKYYAYTTGGMSGAPVFVTINGNSYVAGIHSYGYNHYFSGACRISTFLFDFLNYFLNENFNGAELRDYYYDGITKIRYNTMSELIVTPTQDLDVYLSTNNTNYTQFTNQECLFYTSTTSSTYVDYDYKYFKNYNNSTNQYSQVYSFDNYFSNQARTAEYKIVNKTDFGDIIATSFDQSDNIWYHNSSTNHEIKGTIAYNGYAMNIEVNIPSSGTNLSEMITINGVSFQLRCGPNRVSIKASQSIICSNSIIFAFGVN